jgi:hypothetical protein
MSAFDCGCDSIAMTESFYYSNIAPLLPALNRVVGRDWKNTLGSWLRITTAFSCGVAPLLLRIDISEELLFQTILGKLSMLKNLELSRHIHL